MDERDNVAPISKVAKCRACGASARLDHILPHPSKQMDSYVYRCARCGEMTVMDRPRMQSAWGSQAPGRRLRS